MKKITNLHERYAPPIPIDVQQRERAKMEKSEGELHDYETRARLHNDAVNAGRIEPAKGWVDPA